jgi:N-acetylneuraminic acid mutarotase
LSFKNQDNQQSKRKDIAMKNLLLVGIVALLSVAVMPQTIPNLPIPIGVGSAEVWGDSIYHFGGGTNYGGSTRYATIYKYDGISWQNYASMPDNNVWGISTTVKGDSAFVYGGYAFGNNKLRIYNFVANTWQNAEDSPNISAYSGHTIEYFDGFIYLFYNGYVYKYNVSTNSWSQGTTNLTGGSWLHSIVYQDEIYLVGFTNGEFYKYNPVSDQWTQLADLPYFVTGGAIKCVDDKIYCVSGSSGPGAGTFNNTLVYNIATNQWSDANIPISANRAYMADVYYKDNFYVIGGLNSAGNAVDNVEFIVAGTPSAVETEFGIPNDYDLSQNYPNPFNPSTTIKFSIPNEEFVSLKVFNSLGEEVAELLNETKLMGNYSVSFEASELTSGVYFYQLRAGNPSTGSGQGFVETKKMILLR